MAEALRIRNRFTQEGQLLLLWPLTDNFECYVGLHICDGRGVFLYDEFWLLLLWNYLHRLHLRLRDVYGLNSVACVLFESSHRHQIILLAHE